MAKPQLDVVYLDRAREARREAARCRFLARAAAGDAAGERLETLAREFEARAVELDAMAARAAERSRRTQALAAEIQAEIGRARTTLDGLVARAKDRSG